MTATFDGDNLLIEIVGTNSINVAVDLYSDWKEWFQQSDNAKYPVAFRTVGGDPLSAGLNLGSYFFLRNDFGWRIKPSESSHELFVVGNIYPENAALPVFIPTNGSFTVPVYLERSSLTQVITTGESITTSGIASAVWDESLSAHQTAGSAGYALDNVSAGASPSVIADAVWDEAIVGHLGVGTTGLSLSTAGLGGDPDLLALAVWETPVPGSFTAGTAGARLDSTISSRAVPGDAMGLTSGARSLVVQDFWGFNYTSGLTASGVINSIRSSVLTNLDVPVSTRATVAGILSDSTPFAGANLDVPISTRAEPGDMMTLTSGIIDEVTDRVWDFSITSSRLHSMTAGQAIGQLLDLNSIRKIYVAAGSTDRVVKTNLTDMAADRYNGMLVLIVGSYAISSRYVYKQYSNGDLELTRPVEFVPEQGDIVHIIAAEGALSSMVGKIR